jgi:hypothetical protein
VNQGYRKAALVLSGLAEADRAWMLDQIGAEERTRLSSLMLELSALGISADDSLARELAAEAPAKNRVAVDAGTALGVLAREPDWLIALVLRARPWPWREELLRLLGTQRRFSVQEAIPAGTDVKPRVVEALVAAIERRLEEQAAFAGQPQPAPENPARPRRLLPWRR